MSIRVTSILQMAKFSLGKDAYWPANRVCFPVTSRWVAVSRLDCRSLLVN